MKLSPPLPSGGLRRLSSQMDLTSSSNSRSAASPTSNAKSTLTSPSNIVRAPSDGSAAKYASTNVFIYVFCFWDFAYPCGRCRFSASTFAASMTGGVSPSDRGSCSCTCPIYPCCSNPVAVNFERGAVYAFTRFTSAGYNPAPSSPLSLPE